MMANTDERQAIIDAAIARAASQSESGAPQTGGGASQTGVRTREQIIADASAKAANQPSTFVDVGRSLSSGLLRGTSGLADTVLTGGRAPAGSFEFEPIPEGADLSTYQPKITARDVPPVTPVGDIARAADPELMSYEPKTALGDYTQTGAEFATGMLFPAGKGGMAEKFLYNVAAPALTSETAGKIANYFAPGSEEAEAWARLFGAFAGSPLAKAGEVGIRAVKTPKVSDPIMDTLNRHGVSTTAGNAARDPNLLAREAQAGRTAGIIANQPKQFTSASTRIAGIKEPSPSQTLAEVTEAARKSAGQTYSRVTQGLDMVPSRLHVSRMKNIASDYASNVEGGLQTGTISAVQKGVENAFKNNTSISPKVLGNWRSVVSAATRSASPVARQSAIETLKVLDDVIGRSLARAGRSDDIKLLGKARSQYRDVLAIEGGILKSGKLGDEGIITPDALVRSLSSQGKEAFMRGRRGQLGELARAGRAGLTPIEKIGPVKPTRMGDAFRIASDATGSILGYELGQHLFPGNQMLQYGAGLAGAGAVEAARKAALGIGKSAVGSKVVQEALKRTSGNPASGASGFVGPTVGVASGAIGPQANGGRVGRKAGGRVGGHEAAADQLVRAAERAKKDLGRSTEPLLSQSDDAVAHALEVANRSI